MNLNKREFLQVLGAGTVAGMGLTGCAHQDPIKAGEQMYDVPRFGQVSLLHMTDCHAQLLPFTFVSPVSIWALAACTATCRIWWATIY